MQGYNLVAVFSKDCSKMLMCKRLKDPYKGLINMVGGKIEENEDHETAAYRELFEETGITREQIKLTHLMDFTYHLDNCYVEVYVGRLNCEVTVKGDENTLFWSGFDHDFFDMEEYAGEGNIGHIMEHIKLFKEQLL
ncbi:MAG: NUDIX domain-containing protein [Ruminiclostridium sp.]|nr:NUDIX domain-containing protein [Ruminiclostridium sp.]